MKLAILSDFHLGYAPSFMGSENDAFAQATDAMEKACERADALLVPGDIFDSRTPTLDVMEQGIRLFSLAKEKKWGARVEGKEKAVPVIVIHGTHERRSQNFTNPVSVLESAGLVVDAHRGAVVLEKEGERVAVQGLGGVPEYLAKVAIEKIGYKPVGGAFNIFMFHQSLRELLPDDEALSIEDLPPGFDLYVCGHLHERHVMKVGKTKLIIPGSTVLTQMKKDEEGAKGFYVYDTAARSEEFVPIGSRPFFYREVKLRGASLAEARKACEEELRAVLVECAAGKEAREQAKPIIRLKLTGTLAGGLSSENLVAEVSEELRGKAFVIIVKDLEGKDGEKIALIRDLREQKVSVKELGMKMLVKRLAENGAKLKNVEELFDLLADPKGAENAFEKLKG
ncbi:MAG: metallophosphoesterase family protein [Candidatus Burarchaeum sp.]|nr:metallophosphoesterase [Candidatus Burarchaeum sp.]MDO8339628.1 metallophosphoesterase family protein [Candidatus Burarchaeum sp.]